MIVQNLTVQCLSKAKTDTRTLSMEALVIAGWTGRDQAAIRAHIEELAKLGVPRPATTPIFYRVGAGLLTTAGKIQVMGGDSSGEVEPVVFALDDGLWVGVGSDHTDRKAETMGITVAKQLCPKPVSTTLWRFDEVADHWDDVILRSYATKGGQRRLYQEGKASLMLRPEDLMQRYGGLPKNTAMFGGTMATKGHIEPSDVLELVLEDPVLGRTITHKYEIEALPIAG
jgi:hypothetical protein